MKTHRSNASSSYRRRVRRILVTPAVITLITLAVLFLPRMFNTNAIAGDGPQGFLFVVNTTDDHNDFTCDGNDCSLREAIQAANNIPTADTILFSVTGSISLMSALPAITDDVEITGPGSNLLIVRRDDSASDFRIFNVTATGTVAFSGLTITNGDLFDDGGGIRNASTGTVNVTNSTISGNTANDGGGIHNSSTGTVNVTNSTISGNDGGRGLGGGIHNHSTGRVNVTNSTIDGNTVIRGAGGGISNSSTGTVAVTNSTIINNESQEGEGGGISNLGNGTVNVTDSTISSNISEFRDGGGIDNSSTGTVTVARSTIINNEAFSGGGIRNHSGTVVIANSTISNNNASDEGGGIRNHAGTVNVTDSAISGNEASEGGGGIHNTSTGTVSVTRCTISSNDGGRGNGGGGINNSSTGTVNVTNSTIFNNSVIRNIGGGGIHNSVNGTVNVTNSTISGNEADKTDGGGIFNSGGTLNVKSSIIALNSAQVGPDVAGGFASQGFNLIGIRDGSTGFTASTDLTGTNASPLNPNIDPNGLQDNGGPTLTIALRPGSPAIDKATRIGLQGLLLVDQRSFPRTFDNLAVPPATGGDNTDIGAFELQPLRITAGDSPLINESCPPANGAIDPGERVTVNLELINTSSTDTSNLVATLQTSGGVFAPSAPRNYGPIAANSSAARDFSFTVAGSLISAQAITATLQLQDGAANLGTVSFNFAAGQTPCSFVRLVVTSSLSRTNASNVVGAITVQNIGSLAASDVTLTTARLGAADGTPLPQVLGNLAPGELTSVTVSFANSTQGAPSTLTAGGTYTGGTFNGTKRVTIP